MTISHFSIPEAKDWFRNNRTLLLIIIAVTVIEMGIFKYFYPFPNFLPESTSYIDAASNNQSLNSWPIGYSKFLRLYNLFTESHLTLILFQFAFLQVNLIIFLFTLSFMLRLNKRINWILFSVNILNPILLHLSNFVSSDAIFVGLSLFWFSSLLWVLVHPKLKLLCLHSLALFLAFSFRYYALYYPIISIFVLALVRSKWAFKLKGILLFAIPILWYINHTISQYKKKTGTTQFSSFVGWQLAANALYAYSHSPLDSYYVVPSRFRTLHHLVNQHMTWLNQYKVRPDSRIGIYYQWDDHAPLKLFMYHYWQNDSITNNFKRYAVMGDLYARYGSWIIRRHPVSYLKYFVIPNLIDYYVPPTEFMGYYNMGFDSVSPTIVKWFDLKSNVVTNYYNSKKILFPEFFTILIPITNVVFLASLLAVLSSKTFTRENSPIKGMLQVTLLVWAATMAFSAFTAYIILRYEIFAMILTLTFSIICVSFLIEKLNGAVENHSTRIDDQLT